MLVLFTLPPRENGPYGTVAWPKCVEEEMTVCVYAVLACMTIGVLNNSDLA